jgi:D-beta-D-heptose 7-phosphate kinase/D-beta-D-heptose 1-phosphate adenosyltransferase
MNNKKILLIGDSCKDVFMYGRSTRLCPDAPVPVFITKEIKENGGMAKNVFENISSLGVNCEFITNKEEIIKTRYIDKKTNHMFLRVDSGEEKIDRITVLKQINFLQYDAIVISDYDKGFLTEEDIEYICDNSKNVFIDTKKLLKQWYKKAKFIKINKPEFDKTKHLLDDLSNIIITLGNKGCIFRGNNYNVEKVEVKDTVGAGDTFLSCLVYKYIQTNNIEQSIEFANFCSTKVVQHKGVVTIGSLLK